MKQLDKFCCFLCGILVGIGVMTSAVYIMDYCGYHLMSEAEYAERLLIDKRYDEGLYLFNRGYLNAAEYCLKFVAQRSTEYPIAYYVLGRICRNKKEWVAARQYFKDAIKYSKYGEKGNRTKVNALVMLARSGVTFEEAYECLAKAKRIDPNNVYLSKTYTWLNKRCALEIKQWMESKDVKEEK